MVQYNKFGLCMTLVFSVYPMIPCSSLMVHHGLLDMTTLSRIQNIHQMDRVSLTKKLTRIIRQKLRSNTLKECNKAGEKIIAEIARQSTKIRVKDFIQVYRNHNGLSTTSTNQRTVKVLFKNGRTLTQNRTGKIFGTSSGSSDKNTIFSIQSYSPNILMIQNVKSKKFIAMDKHGHLYSRDNSSHETLFYLKIEENHFYTLASYRYYLVCPFDMFVAIRRNGAIKSPHQSVPGQDSTQFLLVSSY